MMISQNENESSSTIYANENYKKLCFSIKGVMNWEIKIPWHIRGHCSIKASCKFQNSKLSCYSKTAYIEGSQPKRQLVECATLWCNSVAKHRLAEDDQRLLLHRCMFSPAHRFTHTVGVNDESGQCRFTQETKQQTLFLMKFQTVQARTRSLFTYFTVDRLQRHNSTQDFQKDWN